MAPGKPKKRATLQRVADDAGVSKSAASMILSGRPDYLPMFSPETIQRVHRSAAKLDYRSNVFASTLSQAKTPFFALVINGVHYDSFPWYYDAFEGLLFGGVVSVSTETGAFPLVMTLGPESPIELIDTVTGIVSGGVFGTIARTPPKVLAEKLRSNLDHRRQPAVVVFPEQVAEWPSNTIDVDNAAMGRIAGETFTRNGRRKWAVVCIKSGMAAQEVRVEACRQVAGRCGAKCHIIRVPEAPSTHDVVDLLVPALLRYKPDAIFGVSSGAAVSSSLACGEMNALPGKDLDIIGIDCIGYVRGSITSLTVSWKQVGQVAMKKLLELRDTGEYVFPHILLQPIITPGQSCTVPDDLLEASNQSCAESA